MNSVILPKNGKGANAGHFAFAILISHCLSIKNGNLAIYFAKFEKMLSLRVWGAICRFFAIFEKWKQIVPNLVTNVVALT